MLNKEFVYWLHGYLELMPEDRLNKKKLFIIINHLNLVKAACGELGELNSEIYKEIKFCIDNDLKESELVLFKESLTKKIQTFILNNF